MVCGGAVEIVGGGVVGWWAAGGGVMSCPVCFQDDDGYREAVDRSGGGDRATGVSSGLSIVSAQCRC